ncbi:PREDICTED: superkiller viralicidic activity 2-like 2 [Papilio polytes]|uniref:superkiller viralicidic activity 2-like 2 n=1 Tax=Papilio polytes TaxID=76194 RepID=UPI000676ACB8|nr:PREDICTED: superkiller viralicidic activity 2-like 2 [Papilio polytes]
MENVQDLFDCFEDSAEDETIEDELPKGVLSEPKKAKNPSIKRPHEQVEYADTAETKRPKHDEEEDEADLLADLDLDVLKSRIVIHTLETSDGCTHEVAVPPGQEYVPLAPISAEPAKQYSFILDPFQKEALLCIDNLQSVLVSAHTSAGKTVVAEYAIALSLKSKQRVIYTTPIKALSNQKYREFSEEFQDVGLITGDVTINSSASCLIMTTEILRNMLYRGSEIMREVGWVVFDEIHYMRDKERGVVWEETLILLPDNVHYVFLSATIPNARQFAEWVCRLHSQPCHVVYTEYRPTPLQHYIFPAGGDGIHLVVDEKGQFKEDNFNTAMAVLSNAGEAGKGEQRGRRGGLVRANNKSNIFNIVKMVMERNFAPVIIFSFSKKDCEAYAMLMAKLDFNTIEEKKLVDEVFSNAMDILSEEDRKLPQVEHVVPLLRRGIGIHHGGLLPILKETIEILFSLGLIKALFATETFAMGLNMPARTVVFTNCQKYDGKDFRFITSGEYIQMSGRAGRRGLDDKGIVILMIDQKITPAVVKTTVQGKADPINSAFHLTYNMVLNLLRVEEINPEYMLERSFFQFQNQASIPDLIDKVKEKQKQYDKLSLEQEKSIAEYCGTRAQLDLLGAKFRGFITRPEYLKPFLQPGRLVKVKTEKHEYDWGIIVNFKHNTSRGKKQKEENPLTAEQVIIVDILLHVKKWDPSDLDTKFPCPPGEAGEVEVVPVLHTLINQISSLRVYYPKDLRPPDNRKSVLKTIGEVKKRFPEGPPLLNPIKDMKIDDPVFKKCVENIKILEEKLYEHPLHKDENRASLISAYEKKQEYLEELTSARAELKKAKSILHMDELKKRKRVLRRLGYCTTSDVIHLKGRIACELSSADELLLTELIFNGVFNSLSPEQSAALVSCFVCDENASQESNTGEELRGVLRQLQEFARRIAKVSIECNMQLDEDEYVAKFKCTLMDIVLAWCKGATFLDVCKMTDVFEGSIIRCIRRLEEVLRQLCQAAKSIGNSDLEEKFSSAITMLKRDIIFAASLYM